ncbi:MAG: DUF6273 domain-containing protein, partial [Clostridia bacterium]|nr:DUF6273 domain-containing protein [Clostridia bacterium]
AADNDPSYSTSPGNNTTDKVFLLSISEVNKYFSSDSARQCQGTLYCYSQGVKKSGNGNCRWWLRSSGVGQNHAANVNSSGGVYNDVYNDGNGVRPAMWIDLGALLF